MDSEPISPRQKNKQLIPISPHLVRKPKVLKTMGEEVRAVTCGMFSLSIATAVDQSYDMHADTLYPLFTALHIP